MIVDAHVHAWNAETAATPWRDGWRPFAPRPALPVEELLAEMDVAGVAAAALIPPEWDRRGDELTLSAVAGHGDRLIGFPSVSLRDPDGARIVAEWSDRGATGLRQVLLRSPGYSPLEDGTAEWVWSAAEAADLRMAIWAPDQLHLLARVADAHPSLPIAIDHLGMSMSPTPDDLAAGVEVLVDLARRPNVSVKASALPSLADDPFPYRSVHPALRRVLDAFGPGRVFWGSDFARLPGGYRDAVAMMHEIEGVDDAALDELMGAAFARWCGRPDLAAP